MAPAPRAGRPPSTRTGDAAGGWFAYSSGKTPPDPAQSDPNMPFDVPDPPQGRFAAVTDMNGPGRRILYRDVTLDGRYRVHLTVFYVNAGAFSSASATRTTLGDEQQYRIDLISAAAPWTRSPRNMCWRPSSKDSQATRRAETRQR